jgi:hypothetical protein
MKNLLDLIIYIFKYYPNPLELSKPRLVKLIYLADWKHSIEYGSQISEIEWFYNHYGPYVDEVIDLIKQRSDLFNVESKINTIGGSSDRITLKKNAEVDLLDEYKETADFIIDNTANMNWSDFISLVYSTYPIKNNSKYSNLNLVLEAEKFNKEFKFFPN